MKAFIVAVSGLVVLSSLMAFVPANVSAVDETFWSSASPPSHNCSYWTVYPRYTGSTTEQDGPKVSSDGDTLDLYTSSTGLHRWVKTNDFTNITEWIDPGGSEYIMPVGFMPPTDATITVVYLSASFTQYRPKMELSFSVDNEGNWTESGSISEYTGLFYGTWNWNITSLATWTPALLNSTDLWARLDASPTGGTHYYLDYLGFVVYWWAELEGGGDPSIWDEDPPPGTDTELDIDYNIVYSAEGIIGIMGLAGLIGMIATPAFAVFVYRANHGEGKMNIFIKMLVLFMFCLTMFMVSINGA
jgi:hypothetical protein